MKQAFQFVKDLLISHEGNDFHPHIFRKALVGIMMALAVTLVVLSGLDWFFVTKTDLGALVVATRLTELTNENRLAENKGVLTVNPLLEQAAQLKAKDMAEKGYFAHVSPTGVTPWYWMRTAGYVYASAGENLAIDFSESEDVDRAWLNSPTHRANIMNAKFTEIGIATYDGMYQGRPTTFVVQMFGKPKAAAVVPAATVTQTSVSSSPLASRAPASVTGAVLSAEIDVKDQDANRTTTTVIDTETEKFITTEDAVTTNEDQKTLLNNSEQKVLGISSVTISTFLAKFPSWVSSVLAIVLGLLVLSFLAMIATELHKSQPRKFIIALGIILLVAILLAMNTFYFKLL